MFSCMHLYENYNKEENNLVPRAVSLEGGRGGPAPPTIKGKALGTRLRGKLNEVRVLSSFI